VITQDQLKKALIYDPEIGVFTWRKRHAGRAAGVIAGTPDSRGYTLIQIYRGRYAAHRLVWLYVHGEWPEHEIDHINHDKADNRIANLRPVTKAENRKNMPLQRNNVSGIAGVHFDKGRNKWMTYIKISGKRKHLGRFDDFFDAVCVRKAAEVEYKFHENHGCVAQ